MIIYVSCSKGQKIQTLDFEHSVGSKTKENLRNSLETVHMKLLIRQIHLSFVIPTRGLSSGKSAFEKAQEMGAKLEEKQQRTKSYGFDKMFNVKVPSKECISEFVKASGPGGQHVNKTNSQAQVRVLIKNVPWLPLEVQTRLEELFPKSINKKGELMASSMAEREQQRNMADAMWKLQEMVDEACLVPRKKKETSIPQHAIEKRLHDKKRRSEHKRNRRDKLNE